MRPQSIYLALIIVVLCPYASAQWIQTSGPSGGTVFSIAVTGTTLLAGTSDGIYRSTNNGVLWSKAASDSTATTVRGFATSGTNLLVATTGGIMRSTDNGQSWVQVLPGSWQTIVAHGSNLFVGAGGGKVYCSSDSGTQWSPRQTGIPGMYDVHVMSSCGSRVFAGTSAGGVLCSTDAGLSWSQVDAHLGSEEVWAMCVHGATVMFLGAYGRGPDMGIHRSTDAGTTWQKVNNGLTDSTVHALETCGSSVFAGTSGGLFLSGNEGATWGTYDTGMTDKRIYALAAGGGNLYVGTYSGIVWRRTFSPSAVTASSAPGLFLLEQNYPNPFNPSTMIKYELPKSAVVRLSVYDLLGREVSILANEKREAGVYEVKFDALNLSSGVYFYRITAGTFVQTRKMLLLR
jgi:photosystem II stability/assembly factor-like uncharacterized protein